MCGWQASADDDGQASVRSGCVPKIDIEQAIEGVLY